MTEEFFEYRTKKRAVFLMLIMVFSLGMYIFINLAADPAHVVKIKGITLGKTAGLTFLYLSAIGCCSLAIFGIAGFVSTFIKRKVVAGKTILIIPKSPLSFKTVKVSYDQIVSKNIERIGKNETLVIKHVEGTVRVPESALSDRINFELLCEAVKVRATQAGNQSHRT